MAEDIRYGITVKTAQGGNKWIVIGRRRIDIELTEQNYLQYRHAGKTIPGSTVAALLSKCRIVKVHDGEHSPGTPCTFVFRNCPYKGVFI